MVDKHGEFAAGEPVWVRAAWAVKSQGYRNSCRYPKPLVSKAGVRVGGYTVEFHDVTAYEPEAESAGRQMFEHVVDLIEDVIIGFDPGAVVSDN